MKGKRGGKPGKPRRGKLAGKPCAFGEHPPLRPRAPLPPAGRRLPDPPAEVRVPAGRPLPGVDLDDVIYGFHAVEEALRAGERLLKLHIAREREGEPATGALIAAARNAGAYVRIESRGFFARFPMRAHQGVVALGEPFPYVALEEVIAARDSEEPLLIVVLDHVTDPHNLGAIVRSAECAGASAIVLPERRAAGVNATVRKAAAGAVAHLPIARVANIAQALRKLREAGVWIVGASAGAEAVAYTRADLSLDTALVIGAEGNGLSPVAEKACDVVATIPLHGKVASLNASVAAGILLFEARRQRLVRFSSRVTKREEAAL